MMSVTKGRRPERCAIAIIDEPSRIRYKRAMPILKRGATAPSGDEVTIAAGRVREGEMTSIEVAGRKVILTRFEGRPYAVDSVCPHAAADLSKGSLRRWRICCHEHDYCFDLRTGRIVWPEDELYRLRRYEVVEEDGLLKVRPVLLG